VSQNYGKYIGFNMQKKLINGSRFLPVAKLSGLLAIVFTLSFFCYSFVPKSLFQKPKGVKTIVIDAGHGGKDPGCNGISHNEKEVTLAIALKLGKLIEENLKDVKVIYTRKTDVFVPLEERAQIANRNNADLFISIHCNAAAKYVTYKGKDGKVHYKTWKDKSGKVHKKEVVNPVPYGSETYVMGIKNEKGKMEVAKRENAAMLLEDNYKTTYDGFDPNSDEAYIIMALDVKQNVEQSAQFAAKIQEAYREKAGRIDKGVQRQSIWVLWRTTMPSILTEVGFLTNPQEEKFLASEKGRQYMAVGIFRAVRKYKDEQEGKIVKYDDEFENQEALENENIIYEREHPGEKDSIAVAEGDTIGQQSTTTELKVEGQDADKYEGLKKAADEKLKEKKFSEAKKLYEQALDVKKDDAYAKSKIEEIDKGIEEAEIKKKEEEKNKVLAEADRKYTSLVAKADKLLNEKKWPDAKKAYNEVVVFRPGDRYSLQKMAEVDDSIKQKAADAEAKAKYQALIVKADKLLSEKKWQDAKSTYMGAATFKPGDEYAKKKIAEIEAIQKELDEKQNRQDTAAVRPNDMLNSYSSQGKKDTIKKETVKKEVKDSVSGRRDLIEFRVQFTSSDKEIASGSPKLKGLDKVTYYKAGVIFKYTAGNFAKPDDAIKYQNKVREMGYKDAFVVAFKNGIRIDYKEALRLIVP
jgi:N-acetylmuramoyl-L-alanine amidase